jgi:hypothetical protein
MKRTFQSFRISNQLDAAAGSLPPGPEDAEWVSFARSIRAVDRRLRFSRAPTPETPAWLHASIMNQVRREQWKGGCRSGAGWFQGARARVLAGTALVTALCLLVLWPPQSEVGLLSVPHTDAQQMVQGAAVQSTIFLLDPLEVELENLSRDLDRTAGFLLASLP